MSNEELKIKLLELNAALTFEEGSDFLTLNIESKDLKEFARRIRMCAELDFDYLFCVTCVDWKTHLTMVYHFSSTNFRHAIVAKSKLDRANPEIETVCDIWRTAEFHEREVFDLFGVKFLNHPDLRRLFLTDEWVGFPLRKDYEDPINMIKL